MESNTWVIVSENLWDGNWISKFSFSLDFFLFLFLSKSKYLNLIYEIMVLEFLYMLLDFLDSLTFD